MLSYKLIYHVSGMHAYFSLNAYAFARFRCFHGKILYLDRIDRLGEVCLMSAYMYNVPNSYFFFQSQGHNPNMGMEILHLPYFQFCHMSPCCCSPAVAGHSGVLALS